MPTITGRNTLLQRRLLQTRWSSSALSLSEHAVHGERYKVGIVGAGPVGLLLSRILRSYAVDHFLIDRRLDPVDHPQAHFINARSMEILQNCAPDAFEKVVKASPNSWNWRDFAYCHSVLGTEIARIDHFSSTDGRFWQSSPSNVLHLPQNRLEVLLRQDLDSNSGDAKPNIRSDFYRGYDVQEFSSADYGTKLSMRGVDGAKRSLDCEYLIGADGAHSIVRRKLGIEMKGQAALQHLVNVHFTCRGLFHQLQPRPAMLYFVFNEAAVAVLVAHDPTKDEWVCQLPFFPPYQTVDNDYSAIKVRELLNAIVGKQELTCEIHSIRSWVMNCQIAAAYSSSSELFSKYKKKRDDKGSEHAAKTRQHHNVFLIGDAAHQFPPSGGFGMNTGIQDAHNLGWKLAWIAHGFAEPSLLQDTYEAERKTIAEENAHLSMINYNKTAATARALGVDPYLASAGIAGSKLSVVETVAPFELRKRTVLNALQMGLSTLAWLADWKSPMNVTGKIRAMAVQRLVNNGNSLPLIFPEEDLGFRYRNGAIVKTKHSYARRDGDIRQKAISYQTARVGGRLPHFWLGIDDIMENAGVQSFISSVGLVNTFGTIRGPKALLLIDEQYRAAALSAIESLPAVDADLYGLVSISGPKPNKILDHDFLQKCLQKPHYTSDRVCKPIDIPRLHRWDDAEVERMKSKSVQVVEVVDISCYWKNFTSGNSMNKCMIVRPDGHVAMILHIEEKDEVNEIIAALKFALLKTSKVLHVVRSKPK